MYANSKGSSPTAQYRHDLLNSSWIPLIAKLASLYGHRNISKAKLDCPMARRSYQTDSRFYLDPLPFCRIYTVERYLFALPRAFQLFKQEGNGESKLIRNYLFKFQALH